MAILWILINLMCTVNIRGHEANFYETEARKSEAEAEAEWFGLEALTSLLITKAISTSATLTKRQKIHDIVVRPDIHRVTVM